MLVMSPDFLNMVSFYPFALSTFTLSCSILLETLVADTDNCYVVIQICIKERVTSDDH